MTTARRDAAPARLEPMTDRLIAEPFDRLEAFWERLAAAGDGQLWGFFTTPAEAALERHDPAGWRRRLGPLALVEVRLFDERVDLHWLEDRGVLLGLASDGARDLGSGQGGSGDGPGESGGGAGQGERQGGSGGDGASGEPVGGPGWLQRDRASRLWGERLADTGTWYEERIPRPQRYGGLGPSRRYPFLAYREYVEGGAVRYLRYLRLEAHDEERS